MVSVRYDEALGVIRCLIEGFLSVEKVGSVIDAATLAKARCRRLHGDMKMLVLTDGQVQSAEAMKLVAAAREEVYGPYDRRAFVLATSLQKLQVSRYFNLSYEQCFISENAALTWLLADREHRASPIASHAPKLQVAAAR